MESAKSITIKVYKENSFDETELEGIDTFAEFLEEISFFLNCNPREIQTRYTFSARNSNEGETMFGSEKSFSAVKRFADGQGYVYVKVKQANIQ
jgi:hypothetical protein